MRGNVGRVGRRHRDRLRARFMMGEREGLVFSAVTDRAGTRVARVRPGILILMGVSTIRDGFLGPDRKRHAARGGGVNDA